MENKDLVLLLLAGGGGPVVTGLIGWWIKGMIRDIRKVDSIVKGLEGLKEKVDEFSGELKSLSALAHSNNKEIAVLERDQKSQWRQYDELKSRVRSNGGK